MKIIINEMLSCDPEVYEALEDNPLGQNPSLTPNNLKTKGIYEREGIDAFERKIDAYRGIRPVGNLLHFGLNITDVDKGYSSYCNE